MHNDDQIFNLEEANELIPELESLLSEIKKCQFGLGEIRSEIKKAGDNAMANGGSPYGPRFVLVFEKIVKNVEKVQEMGVLVKDMEQGLCDFPCNLDGRIVYLCWKLGESEIKWYHEVQDGFNGRKKIEKTLFDIF